MRVKGGRERKEEAGGGRERREGRERIGLLYRQRYLIAALRHGTQKRMPPRVTTSDHCITRREHLVRWLAQGHARALLTRRSQLNPVETKQKAGWRHPNISSNDASVCREGAKRPSQQSSARYTVLQKRAEKDRVIPGGSKICRRQGKADYDRRQQAYHCPR